VKLAQSLTKLYASRTDGRAPMETVQFAHPMFVNDIYPYQATNWRFTNNSEDQRFILESGAKVWHIAAPFEVGVPEQNGELQAAIAVQFGAVDRRMVIQLNDAINGMPDRSIGFIYRLYNSTSEVPGLSVSLKITDASVESNTIILSADRADFLNTRFPNLFFTTKTFPGLER